MDDSEFDVFDAPAPGPLLGELDLHLINEGKHRTLWKVLGANPAADGVGVRFAVWAPNAGGVSVVGDWNGWRRGADVLRPQARSGVWALDVADARPGHCYKFVIEDAWGRVSLRADPMARRSEAPPSDASIVADVDAFEWTDGDWMQARRRDGAGTRRPMRVYEVHLGSWRGQHRNYVELGEELAAHVGALGFTHVELLPLAEHPFGGSWGYQVSGYYAPTARFGSPADLKKMIDILHGAGIGVLMDWVPAHFPKDDWALARLDGTALYEHHDPQLGEHPDWGTAIFNFGRHEVRNFLVANALYWLSEFHLDGLRVDAVASMLFRDYSRAEGEWTPNHLGGRENLEAIAFLRELNSVVFAEQPGVVMIAEESTAFPGVTAPVSDGGLGFSHKWNMGWMHDTLQYFGTDPIHRRWHHNLLTFGLLYAFSERYVLPLSHDEVVHGKSSLLGKMPGDDWQKFANLRALYAWMWALPGDPMLFMGGEIAPWHEWNDGSSLPWHLLEHAPHRGVRDLVGALNSAAADWPASWEGDTSPDSFRWLDADDSRHSIYSFIRFDRRGRALACVANFTPVPRPGYRVGLDRPGRWSVLIDTDHGRFGGSDHRGVVDRGDVLERDVVVAAPDVPWQGQQASAVVDLPPLAVLWLGSPDLS